MNPATFASQAPPPGGDRRNTSHAFCTTRTTATASLGLRVEAPAVHIGLAEAAALIEAL